MLRKAKNISKKFGIHHRDTEHSEYETSDDERTNHAPSDLVKPDTTGSVHKGEALKAPVNNNLDPQLLNANRPVLSPYKTTPDEIYFEKSTPSLTRVSSNHSRHITFELPVTPQRSKSPSAIAYPKARPVRSLSDDELTVNQSRRPLSVRPRKSGWRLFHDRDQSDEQVHHHLPIFVGTRVRLKMRPLPTFGYVKYIGNVEFDTGEYIGVELDYGVGTCDGSYKGKRYFTTDGKRGIFLQRNELEVVTADNS